MGVAPTLYLGVRLPFTDQVYGDPDHPERVTRTISSPLFTPEDHALIAGYKAYTASLCPGCHIPRGEAWHSEMDGWYEPREIVCHACSARAGTERAFTFVDNTRPASKGPLPVFDVTDTTTRPTKSPDTK